MSDYTYMLYTKEMAKAPRWLDRVIPEPNSGCLLWEGAVAGAGYGVIGRNGKSVYVHRVAWEEAQRAIPDGMQVLHRCDVPACCNIEHLFLGTVADNMRDKSAKGRVRGGGAFNANKTHCKRGHAFDEANTHFYKGARWCRECAKLTAREIRARRAAR
jgi:hypothetical protein